MKFQIDFQKSEFYADNFLIYVLGAYWIKTGSDKYPPFEVLEIEVRDFEHLEDILKEVDKRFETISSAIISFDNPTIFIEL